MRALLVRLFAWRLNASDLAPEQWRVDLDGLEAADARLVLSVLYVPWAEIDLDEPPNADPEAGYFRQLTEHLDDVEAELRRVDPGGRRHLVVRSAGDLDAAGDRVAFVHAVEGGFHLGRTEEAIAANVAELARRGVGYVTLAHLFYRGIATNTPALPMFSDRQYDAIFCQPKRGLSGLGEAAVRAMHAHGVLLDVSHLRRDAFERVLELLDELDAAAGTAPSAYPLLASHAGFRFGELSYMLDRDAVAAIARRDGVVGLILARHQLQDGLSDGEGLAHTAAVVRRHVEAIGDVTGSCRHAGIGSDLDGFIKPTMSGIERAADLAGLERLVRRDFPGDADAILHGNAARVVRRAFERRSG